MRADGTRVADERTLSRIRALAIPPAWTDVEIASDPKTPIQATGRDARRRKQYRYHAKFRAARDEEKYKRLGELLHALPKLRRAVERDLACRCLCKRKVAATVIALIERAQLRVGNDEYARHNDSYGATTLHDRHARVRGNTLTLSFRSKGGITRRVQLTDRTLASIVRRCQELPGSRLFQYIDGDAIKRITSADVNGYLRDVTGGPFTAKDFRTWAATLGACLLLAQDGATIKDVLACVAEKLGHTVAICKKSYVHPGVLEDFTSGKLAKLANQIRRRARGAELDVAALRKIEPLVAGYLGSRK